MFTISAVGVGLMIIVLFAGFFLCLQQMSVMQTFTAILGYHTGGHQVHEKDDGRPLIKLSNISLSFSLAFFILSTELVIRWNHISNVNRLGSTGQLLPFITGLASLVRVLYKFVVKAMRHDYGA
jgi:hypothetical protein